MHTWIFKEVVEYDRMVAVYWECADCGKECNRTISAPSYLAHAECKGKVEDAD